MFDFFRRENVTIVDGVEIVSRSIDFGFLAIFAFSFMVGIFIYFLPTFIAVMRNHKDKLLIFIINISFGWSVLGWIVALGISFMKKD
ncbi:hypothetical protein BKN38_06065 [Helicobacter sp. CLO-3]|uniref:superinfection immunity protein n=1 Tax=unclassified Helicobacter TaxID=2593540 RepID=UPI0008049490|nr:MULTISPECIES: superinfection immunity protein [unclassified Helicobacter]OBV29109.1 hypothetical protein BA723_06805 [Helicobacter sp. CLO-3]OHU82921.1 hypothetical protein BKN38_06065 [Helicobacter sp. CLO-3]